MTSNGNGIGSISTIKWFDAKGRELHSQEYRYQLYPTIEKAQANLKNLIRAAYPNSSYAVLVQRGGSCELTLRVRTP